MCLRPALTRVHACMHVVTFVRMRACVCLHIWNIRAMYISAHTCSFFNEMVLPEHEDFSRGKLRVMGQLGCVHLCYSAHIHRCCDGKDHQDRAHEFRVSLGLTFCSLRSCRSGKSRQNRSKPQSCASGFHFKVKRSKAWA
jgi:hypothetical protein